MFTRHSSVRGFTLTELAIVMGVIGGILGGIWTAAAMVQQNLKVNKAQQELEIIVSNVRALYSSRGAFPGSSFTEITSGLINANVFPSDMVKVGSTSTTLIDPWNNPVKVYQSSNGTYASNTVFEVYFTTMQTGNCSPFLSRVVGNGSDTSLLEVWQGGTGWISATTGTQDATTFSACNAAAFEYKLNG